MLPRLDYRTFQGGAAMTLTADQVRKHLLSMFDSLLKRRDEFLINPASDFTRKKKISFAQTMLFPMVAGADNTATELLDIFGENDLPLPSAMIQRRNQVKKEAFMELFYQFQKVIPILNRFHGYQLVACDGSRLNLPYNPADHVTHTKSMEGRKGINQVHMNALYDLLNDIFLDVEIQGMQEMDEQAALSGLLDKHYISAVKRIYLADRGYASFNIFAHAIHNNQKFVIRMKECNAKALCPDNPHLLDDPRVDETIIVHIGRNRKEASYQNENYHYVRSTHRYDFVEPGSEIIDRLQFRILKFPLGNGVYEYIATNLPREQFSINTIKELYNLRWGEETAFRHLKYAGNMVHIHSLKWDFLIQEIYGKLTMYNFSSCIEKTISKKDKLTSKHIYVFNHTQLQKFVRLFLIGALCSLEVLIKKFMVPVRPGRKFNRIIRRQSAEPLSYR